MMTSALLGWLQLPVFIDELPEKEAIASYLIIVIQLGNVIPLAYVVVRQYLRVPYPSPPPSPVIFCFSFALVLLCNAIRMRQDDSSSFFSFLNLLARTSSSFSVPWDVALSLPYSLLSTGMPRRKSLVLITGTSAANGRQLYLNAFFAISVGLIALTLFAGLVGCFSVVSFFPFASLFKHTITASLSTGMGTPMPSSNRPQHCAYLT